MVRRRISNTVSSSCLPLQQPTLKHCPLYTKMQPRKVPLPTGTGYPIWNIGMECFLSMKIELSHVLHTKSQCTTHPELTCVVCSPVPLRYRHKHCTTGKQFRCAGRYYRYQGTSDAQVPLRSTPQGSPSQACIKDAVPSNDNGQDRC